jgi:hypothetical protein
MRHPLLLVPILDHTLSHLEILDVDPVSKLIYPLDLLPRRYSLSSHLEKWDIPLSPHMAGVRVHLPTLLVMK